MPSPTKSKARPKAKSPAGARRARPAPAKAGASSKLAGKSKPPRLLSGGNPQIAKADGDAPVQQYIDGLEGWKRELARTLDALIVRGVPKVRKAVKWNSPLYGLAGNGWFLGIHTFTHYVKVTFFRGTSLRPLPPRASKVPHTRSLDIREGDALDQAQLLDWLKQAAALPGWVPTPR